MAQATPEELFAGLIASLQMSAWMHLGKMANPVTGKIDRDLEESKATIDLLGALEEKTRGNLKPEEAKFLSRVLLELRMNYVEEVSRGREQAQKPAATAAAGDSPASPGGSAEANMGGRDAAAHGGSTWTAEARPDPET